VFAPHADSGASRNRYCRSNRTHSSEQEDSTQKVGSLTRILFQKEFAREAVHFTSLLLGMSPFSDVRHSAGRLVVLSLLAALVGGAREVTR
jgi:hypothetical protein